MKKRIFSLKLYLEGLRQTKLVGIVSFIILTIQAIAIPVGNAIDKISYDYSGGARGVDFNELNPLLYAVIYIVAPLLALSLFNFLNKRKSSDFYHSIADTRICLFLSYYAAICTWIIGICTLTTLIGVIANSIFPQFFTLNSVNIWLTTLNILAASLYSGAAVTLAMTLTGTLVTNIAVSGLILILPDYLTFMFKEMVMSNIPIAPRNGSFGDALPVGFNFLSVDFEISFTNISNAIYTIVLALIIAAIALVIFKFRKSESAGYPALNKYLQAAIRITFCMVVCIFACGGIFVLSTGLARFGGSDIFALVMIYITALIVYFLYEIITTRKFKTAFRTVPALLIVVVLNIACVFGMSSMYDSYLDFEPTASEIEYITVDQSDEYVYDISSYLEMKCSKIKLKDAHIKEIISGVLSENIQKIHSDRFYENFSSRITVTICVDGIEHQRYLILSEENLNTILSGLKDSNEYKETFCTLPDASSVSIDTYDMSKSISDSEAERMYSLMRKEVAELSFEDWYMLAYGNTTSNAISDFNVTIIDGAKTYDFYIPIYTVFDETANEFVKLTYDKATTDKVVELLKKPDELEEISISFFNATDLYDYYYYLEDDDKDFDRLNKIMEYLVPCDSIGPDDIYCRVNVYDEYSVKYEEDAKYNDYEVHNYSVFFKFTGNPKDFIDEY